MDISDAVIVALIASGVNLLIAFLQNRTKGVDNERKEASRNQYIDDVIERFDERLGVIEKRLEEHNHYAKKFEEVNISMEKLDKKMDLLSKDFEYCKRK